jgi:5-methylthioadenosine/S-adenosylhomocysteine deaminase
MRVLLRNGLVIDTEPAPVALPGSDVLIEDDRILAVGAALPAEGATVIDATDRVVLPGFVDTHRHLWQTALRGAAVDADLGRYLALVSSVRYRPEDVYAATLAGALECLDSGITTVQDFAHIVHTPPHADAGITALREAGIRAVYGYGWPLFADTARNPADVRRVRAEQLPDDDALVTMALAPLGPSYAPIDVVAGDWRLARDLGLPIAVHVGSGPVAHRPVTTLKEHGLLGPATLYVHGNSLPDEELDLIAATGGSMSIAPAVEALMGHGAPAIGRLRTAGVTTGLGVDTVTAVAGDMFSLMRAALLSSQLSSGPRCTAADILRMSTLDGATALGLADRIGSLRPGKQADIVLLRLPASQDPIGTVVTAAHPGNVDTVLVAGQVLKSGGTPARYTVSESLLAGLPPR